MSITNFTATLMPGGQLARLDYTSDLADPWYYVWVNQVFFCKTKAPFCVVPLDGRSQVSVFDSADEVPEGTSTGRGLFFVERTEDADQYELQEYYDSEWVLRSIKRETGLWMYQFLTRELENCQTHQFRVRAKTSDVAGDYQYFSVFAIRQPDKVDATATIDPATNEITFS